MCTTNIRLGEKRDLCVTTAWLLVPGLSIAETAYLLIGFSPTIVFRIYKESCKKTNQKTKCE